MKKLLLIPNHKKDKELKTTLEIIKELSSAGILVYISRQFFEYDIKGVEFYDYIPQDISMIIVVGGDGSIIDASALAVELDVPILGVNLGKVGYLSEVDADNIKMLNRLATGDYQIEERMLLSVAKKDAFGGSEQVMRLAVNDVVASHADYFGISDFVVENGNGDRINYRADGVVIATPVGSTAYSLSSGGPIISHSLNTISVTPVSPHSFFNRTIVFNANETVTVTNSGENRMNISIDGRLAAWLDQSESCLIEKDEKKLKMVTFVQDNMFAVLFKKIKLFEEKK